MSNIGGGPSKAENPATASRCRRRSRILFFDRTVPLGVLIGHHLVVVVNDDVVKDYLEHNQKTRFAKTSPTALRGVIPPNSWVANTGSSTRGVCVQRKIGQAVLMESPHGLQRSCGEAETMLCAPFLFGVTGAPLRLRSVRVHQVCHQRRRQNAFGVHVVYEFTAISCLCKTGKF